MIFKNRSLWRPFVIIITYLSSCHSKPLRNLDRSVTDFQSMSANIESLAICSVLSSASSVCLFQSQLSLPNIILSQVLPLEPIKTCSFARSPSIRQMTPFLVTRTSPIRIFLPCSWYSILYCHEHRCLGWTDMIFDHLTVVGMITTDLDYTFAERVSTRLSNIISVSWSGFFSSMAIQSWTDEKWKFNLANLQFWHNCAI
jgi:hypothetical protein